MAVPITNVNHDDSTVGRSAGLDIFDNGSWGFAALHPRL